MSLAAAVQPLKVLLVAEDRRLLRHLSKSLITFGYEVQQAAGSQQALAALEGESADLVILDAEPRFEETLQLCRMIGSQEPLRGKFVFLLIEDPTLRRVTEALEAGVDDFLSRPVVYGELLSRFRAAARALEFERRLHEQADVDPLTGLARRLPGSLRRSGASGRPGGDGRPDAAQSDTAVQQPAGLDPAACILVDLDLLGRVNYLHGHPSGDAVIRAAADRLRLSCDGGQALSRIGGGRFCVWIRELSAADAVARAEAARAALAETEVPLAGGAIRFTASFGVAVSDPTTATAQAVVDRALRALRAAKTSGRNCVVCFGQFDDDAAAWSDFAAPGKLFERTTARDVMAPCTVLLRTEQTLRHAAALLERSREAALPVVDREGKLAGLVFWESVFDAPAGRETGSLRVADLMTSDVPQYDEQTSFATLRDFFTRDSRSVVVITCQGKPTGLVTPDTLAALSLPLTADSFAPTLPANDTTEYLIVPDLRPLAEA
jgi:diguanylate cyclase (GGDEF)-like protein